MNRILVTGLSLGKEADACQACNFDFEWLVRYPSIFLWADEILVSGATWKTITECHWPSPEIGTSLKLIFEIIQSEGMVKIFDPTEVITNEIRDDLYAQVENDRLQLSKVFPEHAKLGDDESVPGQILLDGSEYCSPFIWSVYAGILLARYWKAQGLFSSTVFNFVRYKYGLTGYSSQSHPGIPASFQTVFDAYLPNTPLLPEYVTISRDQCSDCTKEQICKDTYLNSVEQNVKQLLNWRQRDEIQQLCGVVENIVTIRNQSGIIDPNDIISDVRDTENKLRRRVYGAFPKVQRWANIATMLSIPVAVAGLASSESLITLTAASVAGASKITEEFLKLLSSKYNWIGFHSKNVAKHE